MELGPETSYRRWKRRAALIAAVSAVALCHALTPATSEWHYFFARLYYLPIVLASLYDGWRGGLIVAVLSAISFTIGATEISRIESYLEPVSFCAVAVLTGTFTDRQRRQKRRYQQLTEQLSDVYEKLQANFEGMKRAERLSAIGQLSAGLAHEIRNPLASIAGAASILRRNEPTDPKSSKCLDIIESECKRLNGLLTTFLNFARPRPPHLQPAPVESILESVITLAQHAISSKNIDFRRQIEPGLPPIECDPEQMTQVLLNLVINATEASEARSVVTLVADHTDDTIRIRVVDQGSGVAPEDIDKLFNPFFTTKETGTGLGLPVAHQIVTQMGGLLTAHRNPEGGMTFSIAFPLRRVLTHI